MIGEKSRRERKEMRWDRRKVLLFCLMYKIFFFKGSFYNSPIFLGAKSAEISGSRHRRM